MIESYVELNILEEKRVDLNTKTYIYLSYDEKKLHARISYMGGRLTCEKTADNTVLGRKQLEDFIASFKNDKDVEKYFNIKGGLKVSLEKIVEQIKSQRQIATEVIDREKSNPSTLQSRLNRQRSAVSILENLYLQYKAEISKRLVVVLVAGKDLEGAGAALQEEGMFVYDADSFYEDILNRVPPRMYDGHANTSALFDVIGRFIEDKAIEIDVNSYPSPIFKQSYNSKISDRKGAMSLLKTMINKEVGSEMVGMAALEAAAKVAANEDFAGQSLAVAITYSDLDTVSDVARGLKSISKSFHVLAVGSVSKSVKELATAQIKEISPENIKKSIETIRKKKQEKDV
jgi:hypothetical protein